MNERQNFVLAHQKRLQTMAALCAEFGVSRKTGYKWIERFKEEGLDGLRDQSRAPKCRPNQTPSELQERIVGCRRKRPTWGSKKILSTLERESPEVEWPVRSTIDAILKREGLVPGRGPVRPRPVEKPMLEASRPNEIWTADHKGWFTLGDQSRCEPLTINDMFSRYSLSCRALTSTRSASTKAAFERCFREFGLPQMIMTDNGVPFASTGTCGLSQLSVWFLKLGITPHFIQRGKPQQNGKHERFHRTLKAEAAAKPRKNREAQQRALNAFRHEYNNERPHEALGQRTPGSIYTAAPRKYEGEPEDFEYPPGMKTKRLHLRGYMRWKEVKVYVGEAVGSQLVGLNPIEDGQWDVLIGSTLLGRFDEPSRTFNPEF